MGIQYGGGGWVSKVLLRIAVFEQGVCLVNFCKSHLFFGFIFSMFMMFFSFKAQLRQAAVKLRQLEKGLV
jgi:hypothetical protein